MANNTLSINKIVSIFRDLAVRSEMLNDFGYGPTYNIESRTEPMLFPYLWLDDIGSVIESTDAGYKSMYYTFDLYVMDKINKGDSNYNETISDTNTILNQIFAEMSQHKYYRDMGLNLNGNITMEPVTEATNDNVNGWKATITLKQPYRLTPCNVPIEPITGYTVSLTSNITEYRLIGATGPQGATGPAGATGATGPGANITADNGLTKTADNIQLGGPIIEHTLLNSTTSKFFTISSTDGTDTSLIANRYYGTQIQQNTPTSVSFLAVNQGGVGIQVSSTDDLNFDIYTNPQPIPNNGSDNYMVITDNISSKGFVYNQDYSANFTPESLITKRYLTNYVATASSNLLANNGLTKIGSYIQLGGTLSQNTVVSGSNYDLSFGQYDDQLKTFLVEASDSVTIYAENGYLDLWSSDQTYLGGPNRVALYSAGSTINLWSSGQTNIDGSTDNYIIINDINGSKGAVYNDDYSPNFTTNSLVNKKYVDDKVSTISGGGLTGSGVANRIAYYSSSDTLTSDADFTFDGSYATMSGTFSLHKIKSDGSDGLLVYTNNDQLIANFGAGGGINETFYGNLSMNSNKIINLTTASNALDAVNYVQLDNAVRSTFGCGVDGNSGTIATGLVGYTTMGYNGVITGWDLIGSPTGSIVFDIWKTSANTIPTVSDSIIVSGGPTISNNVYSSSNSLGGWTSVTFSTGDKFGFNIATASTFTNINLSLKTKKTY
jgi:hypothetical protein